MGKSAIFGGCVRNCAPYIIPVLYNILKFSAQFEHYLLILSYDPSQDNTLALIKDWQKKWGQDICIILENKEPLLPGHTQRLAKARNDILHCIRNHSYAKDMDYMIMFDCDNVGVGPVNMDVFEHALQNEDKWDAVSFNRQCYYDVWALSLHPYPLSCWHWGTYQESLPVMETIRAHVTKKLTDMDQDEFLHVRSAFNGFAIYKTPFFLNCTYEWELSKVLPFFTSEDIRSQELLHRKTFRRDNAHECEHRHFHLQAIQKNKARIRICPQILFTDIIE